MKHKSFKSELGVLAQFIPRVRRKATIQGLKLCLKLKTPYLISHLLSIGCPPQKGVWAKHASRVWMLEKEGLTEDLMVTLNRGKWAVPVPFSRGIPKAIAMKYLPRGIDDNNYGLVGGDLNQRKVEYRMIWQAILKNLPDSARPKAIATGNFGYYAERELATAAEMEGIPFFAMHKECLKSKGRLDFFKVVYEKRGQFKGRKILVYNKQEKALQISAKVARPDQVSVCGMPRLDRLHQWRASGTHLRPERRILLAFGFSPKVGLPRIPHKGKNGGETTFKYLSEEHRNLGWYNLFENYHETLTKLAKDNPNWEIQFKLKARHRDADPSINMFKTLGKPDNLKIIVGSDPLDLIKKATAVTGFNTTAVLEAIAAGLPVVTPEFDEVVHPEMKDFAACFGNAVYSARDPKQMYDELSRLMKRDRLIEKKLSKEAKETLDYWVGNADGRASERVRRTFLQEMEH